MLEWILIAVAKLLKVAILAFVALVTPSSDEDRPAPADSTGGAGPCYGTVVLMPELGALLSPAPDDRCAPPEATPAPRA